MSHNRLYIPDCRQGVPKILHNLPSNMVMCTHMSGKSTFINKFRIAIRARIIFFALMSFYMFSKSTFCRESSRTKWANVITNIHVTFEMDTPVISPKIKVKLVMHVGKILKASIRKSVYQEVFQNCTNVLWLGIRTPIQNLKVGSQR